RRTRRPRPTGGSADGSGSWLLLPWGLGRRQPTARTPRAMVRPTKVVAAVARHLRPNMRFLCPLQFTTARGRPPALPSGWRAAPGGGKLQRREPVPCSARAGTRMTEEQGERLIRLVRTIRNLVAIVTLCVGVVTGGLVGGWLGTTLHQLIQGS